jgi:2-methylisocitrate lyase-like PEP mutase family enzyme
MIVCNYMRFVHSQNQRRVVYTWATSTLRTTAYFGSGGRLLLALTNVPRLANMLEGGGKTPNLTPEELEALGFKLCAYPLLLFGVSIAAMQGVGWAQAREASRRHALVYRSAGSGGVPRVL